MNIILDHPAIFSIAGYWAFSALVGGMPVPTSPSGGYSWAYNSLHILAGNLTAAVAAKYPNLPAGTTVQQDTLQKTTVTTPAEAPKA